MNDNESVSQPTVDQFFDALTEQYTEVIERCFPRYREMLWALLDYLPAEPMPSRILELGSGTGNLSVLLSQRYPDAVIEMVDISSDSLDVCRERLGEDSRFNYRASDFRDLEYDAGQFDLVISSIAIHHLEAPDKKLLFARVHEWLTPQGMLAYCDQHAGSTPDLYRRHIDHWHAATMAAGSSEEEWQMWMKHQADHDHHDTLMDQCQWLREADFAIVDCPWRYLLWAVVQARK